MKRVRLTHRDCGFAYRHSLFKNPASRHHIITSVTLKLHKSAMKPPFYASLQHHYEQNRITDCSPAQVRQAVIAIRKLKLPDPQHVANCGSFFKNPIVPAEVDRTLAAAYPDMPRFPMAEGGVKLAAGWLIEKAGLKGYANHSFMTSPQNALVIINQSARTFAGLELFKNEIVEKVYQEFGVRLEQEPETL
jgi:UDP-N-acetylmuramate dehydrogenase